MIASVRPITRIHVLAFDGLRSLWSRRITHASDYSFLQNRSTDAFLKPPLYSTQEPRNGQQRASLRPYQHRVSALFRRLAISPLRRALHSTPPSSSPHHRALSWTRSPHPPLPLPPPTASAHFFPLPPSPPPHTVHVALHSGMLFFNVFLVLSRPPPEPQPGFLPFCSSFLEASDRLCCRPPPTCGGAPGAAHVCLADHFFVLRIIRQR